MRKQPDRFVIRKAVLFHFSHWSSPYGSTYFPSDTAFRSPSVWASPTCDNDFYVTNCTNEVAFCRNWESGAFPLDEAVKKRYNTKWERKGCCPYEQSF